MNRAAAKLLVAGGLLFGAPSHSARAQQSPADPQSWRARLGRTVRDTVLANGLTIVVAENHVVPLVTVEAVFRSGASAQAPGQEGVAHLLEHVLFRAYGDDRAFVNDVADMNGTYNGSTSDERVDYYITAPSKNTSGAIKAIARLVREPKFRDSDFKAERAIVINELARGNSDAGSLLESGLGRRMWGADWARKDAGGSAISLNAQKLDAVRAMYAAQYVPGNAAIIVSGDVQPNDVMPDLIKRYADWAPTVAARTAPGVTDPQPTATNETFVVTSPEERLVTLSLQWAGPGVKQSPKDAQAADVFAEMIGSSLSPLVQLLVSPGVVHSLSVDAQTRARRGPITLTAVMSPRSVDAALPALREEIARFTSPAYLNAELVSVAKKRIAVRSEHWLETGYGTAQTIGFMWSAAGLNYFREYNDAIQNVDLAAVDAFVKKFIAQKPLVAGALASPSDAAAVARSLMGTFGARGAK